jgi:Tol biopolymer transport system component
MGEVYRARDLTLGRFVALKVLPDSFAQDDERRARFLREAQILAGLNHPNIAAIYGWEQSSEKPALIMELVEGKPLTEHITRHGMPVSEALKYGAQIATGLEAAHRAGVIHRDLKPSNVMITTNGNVKLLDFGLAKLAEDAATSADADTRTIADITDEGKIVGSVAYMSPEQAQGHPLDARSDIFSFGSMLFEMLTGQQAFKRENTSSTLAAILRDEPKSIGEATAATLPRDVEKLLRRCLRKDPERRFQTASDLRIALDDLGEDVSSGQVEAAAEIPHRRSRWTFWGACVAAALLVAGGFFWLRSRPSARVVFLRQQTFDAGMALMPALSPDGKLLVYVSDRAGEGVLDLWVRQVAGGSAARLVSGMGSVSNPQFSPDATSVYYLGPHNEIFQVSTLGGPSRKLIDSAGPFAVSAHGDIAFVQPPTGGGLAPMLMMSPGGSPSRWRQECSTAVPPAWSPEGQQVVFMGACNQQPGLFMAARDGSSLKKIGGEMLLPGLGREGPAIWSQIFWYRLANGGEGLVVSWRHGDTVNLTRLSLDGKTQPITQGTGWESWPSVSSAGQIAFTRAEIAPTIWSLPLTASPGNERPRKEVAPAATFSVLRDGSRLVFARMLGTHTGEVVSRDTATGAETILATHENIFPVGSIWIQTAPDGSQVTYRVLGPQNSGHYLLSMTGGSPRFLQSIKEFNVASDWFPDGRRILGECTPTSAGLCALDPVTGSVTKLLRDAKGELLFPSWSWDGKWLTFMRRRARRTVVCVAPVHQDGSFGAEAEWIEISPPDSSSTRPRFGPDGNSIFYLSNEKGVLTLVRQELDPATKHARGPAAQLAPVQVFPSTLAYSIGASNSVVGVSSTRVYFNAIDVRSNVWMTSIE